jgi:branched-chain amino acid transport system permease protein
MTMVTEAAAVSPRTSRRPTLGMVAVFGLILLFALAPFAMSDYHILQLTRILFYAIAIFGLNLLTGFSGQISLGNGAFWALGSYTSVILMTHFDVPYWATPPCAAIVCFIVGYLFGRSATRLEGLYLALATFALAIATPQLLKHDKLESWTGGSQGVAFNKPVSPTEALSDDQWLYLFTFAIAIVLFVVGWNVVRGRTGRAFIALRDHPIAASTMGINTVAYKSLAFGISAMYTGIAGALDAFATGFIGPDSFPVALSIQLLVGSVIGGIASIFGTLFGSAFVNLLPDFAKQISDNAPAVLYGIMLILCMMVMPLGLAGLVHTIRGLWRSRSRSRTRS